MAPIELQTLVEKIVRQVLQELQVGNQRPVHRSQKGVESPGGLPQPMAVANWKMNFPAGADPASVDVRVLLEDFLTCLSTAPLEEIQAIICPPASLLYPLAETASKRFSNIELGAQNLHPAASGAHTGELSAALLKAAGAQWVIVGHSERRAAGETDTDIAEKLGSAIKGGLGAILCVGETLEQRRRKSTFRVLRLQLEAALNRGVRPRRPENLAVAYEPVWAIGTGVKALREQIVEATAFCRETIARVYTYADAKRIRILYGGSVNPANTAEIMSVEEVDGLLVGGASLKGGSFADIVTESAREYARKIEALKAK